MPLPVDFQGTPKIQTIYDFFGMCKGKGCKIIKNPDQNASPSEEYLLIGPICKAERDKIEAALLKRKQELLVYNSASDIAVVDAELANIDA